MHKGLFCKAMAAVLLSICISGFGMTARAETSSALISQYINQLRDNEGDKGFEAGTNLARMADPAATDALIVVLQTDKDPWVRIRAAQTLRDRGDKRAVDALINALKDKDKSVRQWSAEALGAFKDPRAIPALISVLADDDHQSSSAKASDALAGFGTAAIEPLLGAFTNDDPMVRLGAVSAIRTIIYRDKDPRVFDPLLGALKDTSEAVRIEAAWALGFLKDSRAIDPLIAMAKGSDRSRDAAITALGEIRATKAVPVLCDLLNDESDYIVESAADALGRIGDKNAVGALYAFKTNTNSGLRAAAGIALARIGDPRAAGILVGVLDSEHGSDVKDALSQLGGAAIDTLGAALKNIDQFRVRNVVQGIELDETPEERQTTDDRHRLWIVQILSDMQDPRAEAALIAALSTSNAETRSSVGYALRKFRTDSSLNALISMLADKDAGVRDAAIGSLREIGDPRGTAAILALAARNPKSLTDSVVDFLASVNDPKVVDLIVPMLKDKDAKVRMRGVSICRKLNDKRMAKRLILLLSDSNASIREVTAATLGTLGDSAAVPSLLVSLKDTKPAVRQYSAEALGAIKDPRAVKPLLAAAKDLKPDVRAAVAQALGELRDPSTVKALVGLLKENDWDRRMERLAGFCASLEGSGSGMDKVRENASAALGKIGKPAVQDLITCLNDSDPITRQFALMALGEIGDPQAIDAIAALLKSGNSSQKYPEGEKAWARVIERISKQMKNPRYVKQINEIRKQVEKEQGGGGYGDIRAAVAQSLGGMKDPRAVPLLLQLVVDKNPSVRVLSIQSLASQNDPRVLDVLVSALTDSDERVRQVAGMVLVESTDPRVVDVLIKIAKSKTADSQRVVIDGLSKHKTPEATEVIAAFLSDTSNYEGYAGEATRVNETAAIALAERDDSRGLSILLEMLRDDNPDSNYRTLAASTLTRLTSVKAVDVLLRARQDTNAAVKIIASAMLARMGRSEGADTLSLAKAALTVAPGQAAATVSDEEGGATDLDESEIAVYALSMLDAREAVDLLIGALKHPSSAVCAAAAGVLGDKKEKRAVEPLIQALNGDSYVAGRAAEALGKIGDLRAVEPLIRLLSKKADDPQLHTTVAGALAALTGQKFGTDAGGWQEWWMSQRK